ncbi:uncharacterized protein LOC110827525 [Zootermopsis nevadensis]|uniref:uncharacterized protein LOC110827525 n=1 Tax=Zootermopsis nevadensis TaxID=136037 RepID=UPI000B8E87A4|nr:uncharacterized protein LOC110827525 [Zootermopsis nevadensis]
MWQEVLLRVLVRKSDGSSPLERSRRRLATICATIRKIHTKYNSTGNLKTRKEQNELQSSRDVAVKDERSPLKGTGKEIYDECLMALVDMISVGNSLSTGEKEMLLTKAEELQRRREEVKKEFPHIEQFHMINE